jgi:hypothetical protein
MTLEAKGMRRLIHNSRIFNEKLESKLEQTLSAPEELSVPQIIIEELSTPQGDREINPTKSKAVRNFLRYTRDTVPDLVIHYDPKDVEPDVDIIAIGNGGKDVWQETDEALGEDDESESDQDEWGKKRIIDRRRKGKETEKNPALKDINWLADPGMFPAAIPNARIMEYRYSRSYWLSLRDLAENFLECFSKRHEQQDIGGEPASVRPVIFIAYGHGGLILELAVMIWYDGRYEVRPPLPGMGAIAGIVLLGSPRAAPQVSSREGKGKGKNVMEWLAEPDKSDRPDIPDKPTIETRLGNILAERDFRYIAADPASTIYHTCFEDIINSIGVPTQYYQGNIRYRAEAGTPFVTPVCLLVFNIYTPSMIVNFSRNI